MITTPAPIGIAVEWLDLKLGLSSIFFLDNTPIASLHPKNESRKVNTDINPIYQNIL